MTEETKAADGASPGVSDSTQLLADVPPIGVASVAEGFGDPETLFNSRAWLCAALEAKGAKINGGGVGCGQADLDIILDGCRFNVSIRPI